MNVLWKLFPTKKQDGGPCPWINGILESGADHGLRNFQEIFSPMNLEIAHVLFLTTSDNFFEESSWLLEMGLPNHTLPTPTNPNVHAY